MLKMYAKNSEYFLLFISENDARYEDGLKMSDKNKNEQGPKGKMTSIMKMGEIRLDSATLQLGLELSLATCSTWLLSL